MDEDKKILQEHASHIDYWLAHPVLRTIIWESTRNCNLVCKHCCIPRADWRKDKELTTSQAKKIFTEIAEDFNPTELHVAITGGEATLRPDLVEMVRFLRGLSFNCVTVDSNGLKYTRDLSLLDRLFEAGMTGPTIGIDGLREGYRKTKGRDSFDAIIKVIQYVQSRYPDKKLSTFTLVNNYNKKEIPGLMDLLADMGITYARVSTTMWIGRAAQMDEKTRRAYKLSVRDLQDLTEWIGAKRREFAAGKFPLELELSEDGWCGLHHECLTKPVNHIFYCSTGVCVASLLYDGKIGACPHIVPDLRVQGDARTQRFSDVWKNAFQPCRNRDWMKTGPCAHCDQWSYCRGGPMHYRDVGTRTKKCIYREDFLPLLKHTPSSKGGPPTAKKATIIGIVGAESEAHTLHMKQVLEAQGAQTRILDTLHFPEQVTYSLQDEEARYQGGSVADLNAIYVRSVFFSHPPYDLEEQRSAKGWDRDGWYAEYMGERERQSLLTSWLRCVALRGTRVVNPVETFDLHYLKSYQLALLRKNSIPVPKTLVTNSAAELQNFRKEVEEVVYKPVAGGASCKKMEQGDWDAQRLQLLQNAPVLFQEYIPGENIRVYVLGDEIISSCIIHTDAVDYRGHETGIEKITLPAAVAELCLQAMRLCGMLFTGVDLKRTPGGKHVVIECNPSPMFMGIEKETGDPIGEKLAAFLMRKKD